jgi:RsiW-degrading membrane proteinase PrsW (M82 family)
VLPILAALIGWFMLNSEQNAVSGLALVAIVLLIALWMYIQSKIMRLIRSLREM